MSGQKKKMVCNDVVGGGKGGFLSIKKLFLRVGFFCYM
jgi:hypothetical protein